MTYQTAPKTFFVKYILPAIVVLLFLFIVPAIWNGIDGVPLHFKYAFVIVFAWNLIFILQLPFRLKNMTVDDQGLHIKSGRNDKLIPFRNITTVSKFDLASPWAWSIKYVNPSKNTHHKISYIPKAEYQQGFKDDEMTAYIIDLSLIHI